MDEASKTDAPYYAVGLIVSTAIGALTYNHFTLAAFHTGMKLRVAICSVIYRKALRLSRTALGDTAPGKVVNLLSNDVSRFDIASILVHSMWTSPLLALIVGILLWYEVRWAGLVGIAVVFIIVPIQCKYKLDPIVLSHSNTASLCSLHRKTFIEISLSDCTSNGRKSPING